MIQGAIILAIIVSIFGGGVFMGKKLSDSSWQPTYYTLAEQMASMQSELNLKAEKAKSDANVATAEITVIGEVSETKNEFMQKEVDYRVQQRLNKLYANGVQPISNKEGSSNESYAADSLPAAAAASLKRGGEAGLYRDLANFEKETFTEILTTRDKSIVRNNSSKNYLSEQEIMMKQKRDKYIEYINN